MSETTIDFWSRRKAKVQAEAEAEKAAAEVKTVEQKRQALEEKSDAEILEELNLPDPDSLQAGDDFSGFMNKVVPDRLRRRALRKLWLSNSVLANVDGLVDYGDDFTNAATVIENMQTAYQVGKGMLFHVNKMEEEKAAEEAEARAEAAAQEEAEGAVKEEASTDFEPTEVPMATPSLEDQSPAIEPMKAALAASPYAQPREPVAHNDEVHGTSALSDQTPPPPRRRMRFTSFDAASHTDPSNQDFTP